MPVEVWLVALFMVCVAVFMVKTVVDSHRGGRSDQDLHQRLTRKR